MKQLSLQQITDQSTKKDRDLDHVCSMGRARTRFRGSTDNFKANRHSTHIGQDGYCGVSGWCTHPLFGNHHHTFICHKYHGKHTCKQCNLDCLNKTGMVAYLGVVQCTHPPWAIIIPLYVTNITSNIYVNNTT